MKTWYANLRYPTKAYIQSFTNNSVPYILKRYVKEILLDHVVVEFCILE